MANRARLSISLLFSAPRDSCTPPSKAILSSQNSEFAVADIIRNRSRERVFNEIKGLVNLAMVLK